MERREQYDPEDIESLLQERSYDELLEEERAYVLRHLSGREEYEAMRALLGNVREDDRRREPLVADRAVRDHVMAAYRDNLRPQWQVWLNSVGQLLWPKEVSAMWHGRLWRPALAFGSLALLITTGLWFTRSMESAPAHVQVAELEKNEPQKPTAAIPVAPSTDSVSAPQGATTGFTQAEAQGTFAEVRTEPAQADELAAVAEEDVAMEEKALVATVDDVRREAKDSEALSLDAVTRSVTATGAATAQPAAHTVTETELFQNQSMANATGTVVREVEAAKWKKERTVAVTSASLGANPDLLALLSTGW